MRREVHWALRGGAFLLAAATLGVAQWRPTPVQPIAPNAAASVLPVLARVPEVERLRPLFAAPSPPPETSAANGTNRPVLIGIAGRLPDDADVLVRTDEGRTRTLRIGDSEQGWRVVSIAADRVVFERGSERTVVVLKPLE